MSEYNCDDCTLDCAEVVKALCRDGLIDDCKQLHIANAALREAIKKAIKFINETPHFEDTVLNAIRYNLDQALKKAKGL